MPGADRRSAGLRPTGAGIDPRAFSGGQVGWILFQAHRYDEAIRELRTALTVKPKDPMTVWLLGFALTGAGQFDEAIRTLEEAASLSDGSSLCWVCSCMPMRAPAAVRKRCGFS